MSRRKQARPKSCKSEDPTSLGPASSQDDGTVQTAQGDEHMTVDTVDTATHHAGIGHQGTTEDIAAHDFPNGTAKMFRCDGCGAGFESRRLMTDHKTLCAEAKKGWPWPLHPPPTPVTSSATWPLNPSPVEDSEDSSALEEELFDHDDLDPAHVPYAIGVNDDHAHSCHFCEKAFSTRTHLALHEQTHASQMPYKCQLCPRVFRHKKSQERHEKLHDAERKYTCPFCGVGFSRSDHLKNHILTHEAPASDPPYKCSVCQLEYASSSALSNHLKTHKSRLPENTNQFDESVIKKEHFVCDICQEIFFSQDSLQKHTLTEHTSGDVSDTIKCPVCVEEFSDTELLCQHIMTHSADSFGSLDMSAMDVSSRHIFEKSSNGLQGLAESSFQSEAGQGGGPGSHGNQPVVCPYCMTEGFDSLESLELHLTSVHMVKPTEVYTCNFCNAPYPNLYSLHDHMTVVHRSQHGLDITYPCAMCVQRFHSLDALAKHKGIVHAEQRYTGIDAAFCNRCNMTLTSPKTLEEHMANIHGIVMERKPPKGKKKKSNNSNKEKSSYYSENSSKAAMKSLGMIPSLPSFLLGDDGGPQAKYQKMNESSPVSRAAMSGRGQGLGQDLYCPQCSLTFPDHVSFSGHMALHAEANLSLSLMTSGGQGFKVKEEPHTNEGPSSEDKSLDCFKCGASFKTEEQLEAHASLHYLCVTTEYGCSNCVKNFSKPDELQKHLMDIHAHHLYRCSLCKDIFDSKVNIQVHFAIKHSNECKLYKCVSCDMTFRSETEWQVHVRVNHLHMAKPYRCLFCQEAFTSEVELQCHLTSHNKQFSCSMCDQAFHIEYLLDQHMSQCHSGPDGDMKSPSRKQKNRSNSGSPANLPIKQEAPPSSPGRSSSSSPRVILKPPSAPSPRHTPSPHMTSMTFPPVSSSPLTSTPVTSIWKSSEPLHMCNICDVKFSNLGLLTRHKAEDHGLKARANPWDVDMQTQKDKLLFNNQTLLSALNSPVSSDAMTAVALNALSPLTPQGHAPNMTPGMPAPHLSCMFCSQTFKTPTEYSKHMKIHVNSGNLTCSICDETFNSPSVLAEHKLTHCKIHQGNTCVVCRVPLNNQEQFYIHSQEHGFEGSLLQCVVCRQTLMSLVELQMHGRHHFQSRPSFSTCCVCLKSFQSKENLVAKLNSSGRTYYVCKPCYHGEAPLHTCSQCSDKFATAQLLEAHMASHKSNFQCIKCQQSFSSEEEIQLHVASHMLTEGTQHECRLCGATFQSPARLQTHLITHSLPDHDMTCYVCSKTFASAQEIQVHALEHGSAYKQHTCDHCELKFFFSAELDNHRLISGHGSKSSSPLSMSQSTLQQASPVLSASLISSSASMSMASIASLLSASPLTSSQEVVASALAQVNRNHSEPLLAQELSTQLMSDLHDTKPPGLLSESSGHPNGQPNGQPVSSSSPGLECPECHKHFSTGTALANHRKTHAKAWGQGGQVSGALGVRCSLCPASFPSALLMQQHFFSAHGLREEEGRKRKKTFPCMMCDKECSTLSALQNHILSHRTQPRAGSSLPCEVCKKTFTSQRYLNLHMRVHMKKKTDDSFVREVQGSEMREAGDLRGQPELTCPVCSVTFSLPHHMEAHLNTHQELFTTNGSTDMTEIPHDDQTSSHASANGYGSCG